MADRRPDAAAAWRAVDHRAQRLERIRGGGFSLVADGRPPIRVIPAAHGWIVQGPAEVDGWSLRRSESGGFVVHSTDAAEVGQTMPVAGGGMKYMLLADGRLFRSVLRGPREPRFELAGWETPGPYLIAHPRADGWTLAPTPACCGLQDIDALSILFAAEILDAEDNLQTSRP